MQPEKRAKRRGAIFDRIGGFSETICADFGRLPFLQKGKAVVSPRATPGFTGSAPLPLMLWR